MGRLNDSTAREIIWGVDTKATLEAIGAEIAKDREVKAGSDGILRCRDDHGYSLGFMVSQRKETPLSFPATNTVGNHARRNRVAEGTIRRPVAPSRRRASAMSSIGRRAMCRARRNSISAWASRSPTT